MCGRYTLTPEADELVEAFDLPTLTLDFAPRYNIAPGQMAPVIAQDRNGRRMGLLEWGLVPHWMVEPQSGFINARAESVGDKPSFREAFARRRCLVPADGFYEWQRTPEGKVPHWFHPPGRGLLTFAGIWESWRRAGAEPRHAFAILTTDANEDVASVHDRMPVVVAAGDRDAWLSGETESAVLKEVLSPAPAGTFSSRVVSTRVNRPAEDDAELIEPVE